MKISKEIVFDLWKTEKMQNFQNLFYLSGWIAKAVKVEYAKGTSKEDFKDGKRMSVCVCVLQRR